MFIAGCGRFFEGTAKDMFSSLHKLSLLPKETKVYCGHEYTNDNLKFAQTIEPKNKDTLEMIEFCKDKNETVPSTIEMELKINPFMRVDIIKKTLFEIDSFKAMEILREKKNNFR